VAQLVHQLTQEQRNSAIDLRFRSRWREPRRNFRSASADQFVAIVLNEFIESDIRHAPNRMPALSGGLSKTAQLSPSLVKGIIIHNVMTQNFDWLGLPSQPHEPQSDYMCAFWTPGR